MNASTVEGRVLSKWVDCRRRQGPVCEQKMAVLHVDRLTPDRSPFKSVEIIKIAHSLETDSFSAALRRFIGRKGQIKEIRSDNGTNFTGARENLGNPSMHETTTKSMRLYYRRISCGYLTPPPPFIWVNFRRRLGKLYSHVPKEGFFVAMQVETSAISCQHFL